MALPSPHGSPEQPGQVAPTAAAPGPPTSEERTSRVAEWLRREGFFDAVDQPSHLDPLKATDGQASSTDAMYDALRKRTSWNNKTVLFLACENGELWLCEWLYEHGVAYDIRTGDRMGQTPLHAACERGHLVLCEWLFAHGAAEDVRMARLGGWTPMWTACRKGHLAVCQWLFDHGAAEDVRTRSGNGTTPLLAACFNHHLAVCQWLVGHGAAGDVAMPDNGGRTPFGEVCANRHAASQRWLLRVGGRAVLTDERVLAGLRHTDHCADLVAWLRRELALHDGVLPLVLWGMMRPHSGAPHLWWLGRAGDLPRRQVFCFVGVEFSQAVLGNMRSALVALQAISD